MNFDRIRVKSNRHNMSLEKVSFLGVELMAMTAGLADYKLVATCTDFKAKARFETCAETSFAPCGHAIGCFSF